MSATTDRIHVLHVDDEPDFADMAAEFLEREDDRFTVETATSASEGMDRLAADDFDCIVSDYDMPGENGIEFLETVREDHPDLPFILFTGKGSEEVASDAIRTGVSDYLQKESGTEQYELLANDIVNLVEKYRTGQELDTLRRQYTKLVEQIFVGIYIIQDGEFVYVNPRLAEIHGYDDPEEITGMSPLDLVAPEERDRVQSNLEQRLAGEVAEMQYQTVGLTKTGNSIDIELHGSHIELDGEPAVIGSVADISERKERERTLKRFKNAVENAGHAVYMTDSDGTIEYVNPAFETITGYSADEAVGRNPRILKSGEMSDGYYEELWETLLDGSVWEEEIINRRHDGKLYYAHQTIAPILDENDDIDAFVAIQTDITDRKEKRERLQFLETLENELIELSTDFLRPEGRDIDTLIDEALETLGRLVEADRSYVFEIDHEAETLSNTFEWCAAGVEPQIEMLQDLPLDTFPWWMQQLENFENITIPNVAELPPEAEAEQEILQDQNIESLIVTPMISQNELVGFIGFDWVEEQEAWSDDFIEILRMASELITSARRRDARRRELERHEAYLEESQDSITVVDEEGKVQFQSESVAETTGYRPSEIMGESGFEYVHPDDRQKVTELFTSVLGNPGETASAELRVETKDGSWRWVAARGVNKLDDPVINGIITSSRDITEKKERERELELFEQLIDQSNDEVYVTDAETGVIQRVNQTACDHLGYSEDELVGMTVPEISDGPDDVDDWISAMERVQEQGGGQIETVHTRADGTSYPVEVSSSYVEVNDDAYVVTIVRDITERKEREQQLRREKERLDEFASVVSHDLRNPLNVAQGRIDLAQEECDTDHLDAAAQGVEQSLDLIEDMLELARAGQVISDKEPVAVGDLVDACWDTVETDDATLVVDLESTIRADRTRLRQLLENLFRNAVEHGGDDVTVRIGSLQEGFYVEDDGPGIPEYEREDIWEAGYSGSEDGTGFGLNIVQEIAEAHGWDIAVTDSESGGARFEITGVATAAE